MLKTMLTHIDFLNEQIVELDLEVAKRLDPFQQEIDRLDTILGIGRRKQILAEVGTDVGSLFPFAPHLCTWLGLVPGQNESAGKRKSSKTLKGNKYLRAVLIEVTHSVSRSTITWELRTDASQPEKADIELP
jgi:transposase